MSEIVIALLLIAPVLLVIAVLTYSRKKQKRKKQDKLFEYLHKITGSLGFQPDFQKHLVDQFVFIDKTSRKILVIKDHDDLSHELLSLDDATTIKIENRKETIRPDGNKRAEVITKQIGVEIAFEKPAKELFLVVYDHIEHNIFQMADLEKEARELHEIISKAKIHQLVA